MEMDVAGMLVGQNVGEVVYSCQMEVVAVVGLGEVERGMNAVLVGV
jgi:hypothetical protein